MLAKETERPARYFAEPAEKIGQRLAPMRHLRRIFLMVLVAASPLFATQSYYVSSLLTAPFIFWSIDDSGVVSNPIISPGAPVVPHALRIWPMFSAGDPDPEGYHENQNFGSPFLLFNIPDINDRTDSGPINLNPDFSHMAPIGYSSCPSGVTPNWAAQVCEVVATNSLGDQLIIAGDSWFVSHTGGATDLTATTKIGAALGLNNAGDVVGWAAYDSSNALIVPGTPPCHWGPADPPCSIHGVLLPHGTSTLIDLNTALSPALSSGYYSPRLIWMATAINNVGQIVTVSPGPYMWEWFYNIPTYLPPQYNEPRNYNDSNCATKGICPYIPATWPTGCTGTQSTAWILTPCTAGSCPADAYTYTCPR